MIFLGIDPGLHGGIAFVSEDMKCLEVLAMPIIGEKEYDIQEIKNLFVKYDPKKIFGTIEQQIALPEQGLSSTLQTGKGYGIMLGLLSGLSIAHQVVSAKSWQSKLFVGVSPKLSTKERSITISKRLYPLADLRRTERSRVSHDGLADALCIAEFGRRQHTKGGENSINKERLSHQPMIGNPEVCGRCGRIIAIDEDGCII